MQVRKVYTLSHFRPVQKDCLVLNFAYIQIIYIFQFNATDFAIMSFGSYQIMCRMYSRQTILILAP